jgi:hypothetical protein
VNARTLIFEIALPDFYAEDLDPNDEILCEMYGEDDAPLTDEQMFDAISNESGLITGGHVRVLLLTGDKGGNELQRMDGWIVAAKVVPRAADHEREKDERLDDYEEHWAESEVRRLRNA